MLSRLLSVESVQVPIVPPFLISLRTRATGSFALNPARRASPSHVRKWKIQRRAVSRCFEHSFRSKWSSDSVATIVAAQVP